MSAGSDDRIVADLIAFLTGNGIERAFQHTFRTRLVERRRQLAQNIVETMLGCGNGLAHFTNLIFVLAHASLGGKLMKLVIGIGIAIRIGETVRLANILHHFGDLRISLADHTHTHGTSLRADILAQCVRQLCNVIGLNTGHCSHLLQAGTRSNPIFSIMGIHEKVLRVVVRTRSHKQFRHMRLAGRSLRRIRINRIQHQHCTGLVVFTQTGVIRKRRIRTERIVAVIVAHLRLTGRNHNTLSGKSLAQRVKTSLNVMGRLQRFNNRLIIIPTGGHELLERLGTRAQRTIVHTVTHRLIGAGGAGLLHGFILLVFSGNDFVHHIS